MSTVPYLLPPGLEALRRFGRAAPTRRERCELCNATIADEHAHLAEPASGRLLCVCEACGVLFGNQGGQKYRRVRRPIAKLDDVSISEVQWANLAIPIGLAFLFRSTPAAGIVAVYPSPVGPMRSQPSADAWQEIVTRNPCLQQLDPDTEALLVHRIHPARECYLVPIDECYKLVGLVRSRWRGISGGTELWETIAQYFTTLRRRASHA